MISKGENNLHKYLLPVSAAELLIEERMIAAVDKLDFTFERWMLIIFSSSETRM